MQVSVASWDGAWHVVSPVEKLQSHDAPSEHVKCCPWTPSRQPESVGCPSHVMKVTTVALRATQASSACGL
jgi:hypothetical protein